MYALCANMSCIAELNKDAATSLVNEAHISQPSCTAIQLALTDLLRAWGVSPTAVAGHSSGEIGAAYAAGILPLESCMAISYYRGLATIELKKRFPELKGAMMAIGCSEEEITPLIAQLTAKEVRIACFNSPQSLTISGDEPAIDQLQAIMEKKEMFNRKLQVDVAYHSHHMKLVAKSYLEYLQSLDLPKSTAVMFHSSLFGDLIDGAKLEPSYWVDNLTESVRFSEALTSMCQPADGHKTGVNMIVEIGPHSALAGPVKQILKACGPNAMKISYASALVRKRHAVDTALELASALFVKGAALNLGAINLSRPTKPPTLLVDMPRYPWNHQTRYWYESRMVQKRKARTIPRNDILGTLAIYSNDLEPTWRNILRIDDLPWLQHHKIQSLTLFPISGFIAMALEAASQRATTRNLQYDNFELRNVTIRTPLMIGDDDVETTLQLRPHHGDSLICSDIWEEFRIHSWAASKGWTEHCRGLITVKCKHSSNIDGGRLDRETEEALRSTTAKILDGAMVPINKVRFYDTLSDLGVSYGPSLQGMENCQTGDGCSTANVTVVDTAQDMPQGYQTSMIIHPTVLEQIIKMYWAILGAGRTALNTIYLPSSIGSMTVSRGITELMKTPGNTLRVFCQGTQPLLHPKPMQVSIFGTAADDSKEALVMVNHLTVSPVLEHDMSSDSGPNRELCYRLDWEPILQPLDPLRPNGVSNGVYPLSNGHLDGTSNGTSNGASSHANIYQNGTSISGSNGHPVQSNGGRSTLEGLVTIVRGHSELQKLLALRLVDELESSTGKRPDVGTLTDVKIENRLCLFLSELDRPLLSSLTLTEFTALQRMLTSVQGILWVVRGAYVASQNPDANMVTGLSRSIRSETLLKFATLDLDSKSVLCIEDTVNAILEVFKATFSHGVEENCELEYIERNGGFFTPRIVNDKETNEYVHKQTTASILDPTPFKQDGRALKIAVGIPGAFETIHFVDQSVEDRMSDDEIEIEVRAIGMNSRDVSAVMGQLDAHDFGVECSGIVTKVGRKVTHFTVGNRVAGISISGGVYSTYAYIKASFAFRIRDDISFEDAASIPVAFCTAHYGLLDLGHIQNGERILIHGAATASGQAAICLAQMVGVEIFASVSSVESKDLLINRYGVPYDHIFSSNSASLGSVIHHTTGQCCFDVILNCRPTDTDTLRDILDRLSNFGRFIDIGQQESNPILETARFQNNRSFMSVDLISMAFERPKLIQRLVSNVSDLLCRSTIRASSITTFPISDAECAFKLLQCGKADGKLILSPQPGDTVKVCRVLSLLHILISLVANNALGNSIE